MTQAAPPRRRWPAWGFVVLLLFGFWLGQAPGILSSNDGSHIALSRALGLRHETPIDPDAWMTLGVDMARRDAKLYSDRPPGTAVAAMWAARLGARLDPVLAEASMQGPQPGPVFLPWGPLYDETKRVRSPDSPPAFAMQGTAWAFGLHACLMAALGLWALGRIAEALGHGPCQIASLLAIVGLATAYGGYAPVLFNHVSATTLALWSLAFALRARNAETPRPLDLLAAGLLGAWAIACDYSFVMVTPLLLALTLAPPRWPLVFAGSLLPALAVAAYHEAAFGSVFAIGYDFNTNFEFARERTSTFGANPLHGAWALFGFGAASGWLARSPILWLGLAMGLRPRDDGTLRRWWLALLPWTLLICTHQTPTGGAGNDYRYLTLLVPFAVLGLAHIESKALTVVAGVLALVSVAAWWPPFLFRFELPFWPHAQSSLVVWALTAGAFLLWRRRTKQSSPPP